MLCFETPIAALLSLWAFPPSEFSPEAPPAHEFLADILSFIKHRNSKINSEAVKSQVIGRTRVLENVKDALGVSDVMEDAMYTFKSRYSRHTRLNDEDMKNADSHNPVDRPTPLDEVYSSPLETPPAPSYKSATKNVPSREVTSTEDYN